VTSRDAGDTAGDEGKGVYVVCDIPHERFKLAADILKRCDYATDKELCWKI
jgi:hypothetical protein